MSGRRVGGGSLALSGKYMVVREVIKKALMWKHRAFGIWYD